MITYGSTTLTSYNTITKIEVYYYKSTSATSLSGGSWSTTKPTWENGKYIWQKIRTTYEGELENGLYYSESDPVNITGQQGQTGTAAYSYKLNASDTSITVSKDGTYSKTSVTFSATSKQGTGAVNPYKGVFKIETTANGTTWTTQYTSSANESSKEYTIPTGILNIRCSLYQAGGTSVLLDIVSVAIVTDGKDGTNGTNGLNNARVILYRRFSAAPSGTDIAPTGNVTYTFSTGVAANNLNSWTQNIPTGTDPVYMIAASASNTGATDTIAKTEWSAPIKILENGQSGTNGTNGTNGIDGYNQATIYLYQRKSGTAPSKPSSAVTYTFSTGALSSTPSGWSRTIPANDGNPCYVTTATAIAKTVTYSIAASAWSAVVVLSENGTSITITSTTVKYQKGTSGTTKPTGTWETSIPSIGENEFLWTQTIVNYSDGSKTEAYSVSRNAINGISPTVSSTTVEYQQSTGGTTPPTGTWSTTAPTATAGQYMWTKTTITYSDDKTAVSYSVSKNGANGIDGIDGTSQNLLLDVYASSLTKVKAPWDRYLSDTSNSTITGEFIAESNLPDPNATHFYRITDSSASTKGRGLCFYNGGTPPFINGHTYRIGCWVRNHSGKPRLYIYLGSVGEWLPHKTIENTDWEWVECVRTFGDTDPTINEQASTYKRIYFYLSNNNVANSSLDMCGFKIEEIQTDISTARNYLLKTEKLEGWRVTNGATINNGVTTFPEVTANTWREIYPTKNFKYELIRNKNIIFSVRVKADTGKKCACNLCIGVDATETAYSRQKYRNNFVYFTGDGEWHTICAAMPISDEFFNGGSGTPDYDNCWVTVRIGAVNSYHNGFQLKEPQLSLGTTATAWTPAPEDIEANMQEKVDNIEIGGRNILLNSATNFPQKYGSSTLTTQSNVAIPEFNCTDGLRCYGKTGTGNSLCLLINNASHGLSVSSATSVQDQQYVLSMYIKNNHETNSFFVNSNIPSISGTQSILPGEAKRVVFYATGNNYHVIQIVLKTNAAEDDYDITFWHPQIELGNKVTDWSPAPEDTDASIQQVQDNLDGLEIGGRNLLYNSATMPAISNGLKGWRASGGTVTHIDLTDPPVYNISGAIRVTNTGSSITNIGIAQDRITNKFITGEKYTQSCWVRASETLRVYLSPIWAANGQSTGGSVSSLGYFSIGTEWTYIKWEGAVLQGTQATSYSAGYVYAYQAPVNSWLEVCGMKLEKGAKATDWTPAPEDTQADIDTALAQSVEYIIGTQTAATGSWTGVSSSLTELKDGTQIRYWLPYAGSGNATLNLTLKDGTATGAIPVYRQGGSASSAGVVTANRVTTHFPAGTSISMVYGINRIVSAVYSGTTYTGTFTGWFADGAYDSGNTYNRTRMQNAITAATAITAGHIICGTSSGYKNIGASIAFDLSYPLLYAASAITAAKTGDNNYLQINGISASNNGTITSGAAKKVLYLKGTVSGNIFTISASPFMTTVVPTSEDGFYYIPLGMMYSATAIYFNSSNRLYAYIDGAFQPVDTAAVLRAQDAKDRATAVYGTCSTGATTVDKVVTCPNFTLFDGARIQITFTNANTAVASEATTASPTLNVNGTGAKPIKIGIETANATNPLYWAAGAKIEFVYDGSAWILQNAPYTLYGTCNTEESVVSKQVVCEGAVICKGTTIYVDMGYSNTAENATLNVANTVAKTIYANNSTLTTRSRYNWNAGEKPSFTFDGQYWQMDKDTVPAYITDNDDEGIFVHPVNDTTSGWSIGKVFELLNNGYSYIKMWLEDVTDNLSAKIRIGREDQHHILLDKEIIQFKKGDTSEELASFSSSGISFDEGVPFKIGNDSAYVQFVDNNSDGVADALEIVADRISFKNGGDDTAQDIQERFNDLQTDISNITNNIEINPTANIPYVAITTQKNEYNAGLKLEPTQLSFQLNGQTTATIANDEMNIPTASVTNLFMQSANQSYEKIWVMRSNGHLSLKVGKQN